MNEWNLDTDEKKTLWIFPDTTTEKMPMHGSIRSIGSYKGKSGFEFNCLTLDVAGREVKISLLNKKAFDISALMKKYAKASEAIGQLVSVNIDAGKVVVKPLEEKIE